MPLDVSVHLLGVENGGVMERCRVAVGAGNVEGRSHIISLLFV